MDLSTLKDLASLLAIVISLGTGVFAWFASRRKDVDARLSRHSSRLDALENDLRNAPDKEAIHQIALQLAEMNGVVKAMSVKMEGNHALLTRLETAVGIQQETLMKGGK
ncbi:MAG: hypothetical protein AAF401_12980 [Pseudomonadota bacterium]